MHRRLIAATLALLAVGALSLAPPARAQTFPNKNIHVIVAYAPGGTGDIVARLIAAELTKSLGQNVVIENRAGATGAIGTQAVASATPDGHTLLLGQTGEVAINQHWIKGLSYNPETDLVPVALASVVPLALVVGSGAPYATIQDMVKAFRGGDKPVTFASAGTGTPGHFAGEFLKIRTKGNLTHVPYKGAGPALNDLLGGHVDMYFPGFPAAMPHVTSGKMKVLAVSSAKRSGAAPEIPTVGEAIGDPNFDLTLWQGFFAPKGTPKAVVDRLNSEINKILESKDMQTKLLAAGADVRIGSSEQFVPFVKAESDKYRQIIQQSGVKPE